MPWHAMVCNGTYLRAPWGESVLLEIPSPHKSYGQTPCQQMLYLENKSETIIYRIQSCALVFIPGRVLSYAISLHMEPIWPCGSTWDPFWLAVGSFNIARIVELILVVPQEVLPSCRRSLNPGEARAFLQKSCAPSEARHI